MDFPTHMEQETTQLSREKSVCFVVAILLMPRYDIRESHRPRPFYSFRLLFHCQFRESM
jgi:hypothetical protein